MTTKERRERVEQIDTRLAEIDAKKHITPLYLQTKLLDEESVLKTEIKAIYYCIQKARHDLKIKESKPNRSAAEARADSAEFSALQQEHHDLTTKYPELKNADLDKISEAQQKAQLDKINKPPPDDRERGK